MRLLTTMTATGVAAAALLLLPPALRAQDIDNA